MNQEGAGSKWMNITPAEIVTTYPEAADVFIEHGILFCCESERMLREICEEDDLDATAIYDGLSSVKETPKSATPSEWTSAFLTRYITETHHQFLRKILPELPTLLNTVCSVHGSDLDELLVIRENFVGLCDLLASHIRQEEETLFPLLSTSNPSANDIDILIDEACADHDVICSILTEIRSLSNQYTAPDFACPTFRLTFQKLKELDHDLVAHLHLENNILFRRNIGINGDEDHTQT
jgi:regulator of cell morphogenesis and NO signaling